eukprot:TRINITY_DN16986_c0_g1_i2.p1 TRINITY_DN16986_c0_g1~~TRINITY_DN16986_c0_g1_i2.p1  ORF type:complete len:281 (-),score=60.80 TRINITY_DN16986_c0_g1_i2:113-955(-)
MTTSALADGRTLTVFENDAAVAKQLVADVTAAANAAISAKGSFSLCIPAGSVVSALKELSPSAVDWSKDIFRVAAFSSRTRPWAGHNKESSQTTPVVNVFFTGERLGANKSYTAAIDAFCDKCKIENVFFPIFRPLFCTGAPLPEFAVKEATAAYTALLKSHPAIDNSGPLPSFDLLLLGVGDDGHCGSLHPQSAHIKAAGDGTVTFGIHKEGKNQIAISMDVMRASKKVILACTGDKKKDAVRRALSGDFEPHGCPAALVKAAATHWYVDKASLADFKP